MMQLRSVGYQIVVNAVNKVALSCFDDKRYILDDTGSSLAYGHYSLGNPKRISSKLKNEREVSADNKIKSRQMCETFFFV